MTDDRCSDVEPYYHGILDVGDGNVFYWETCGNSSGKPAVALHGGPGSGCTPGTGRYFDPGVSDRTVRSAQLRAQQSARQRPAVSMAASTTPHLIADIEGLRSHLGIDRWLVQILIDDAGHGGNAALFSAILSATDRCAHKGGNARG